MNLTPLPTEPVRLIANRYLVERELGKGGMATVLLAVDQKLERPVAIKLLREELATALGAERFLREIRIAAGLDHPNIVALHEAGEWNGRLYYVMPVVDGESLRERLRRPGGVPMAEALHIVSQVADALAHAHAKNVIHRDIKPENILLAGVHAKVADFGIAQVMSQREVRLTRTGFIMGTPAYMSPEQLLGEDVIDGRSDLYSLACVLFEMLAGHVPFNEGTPQARLGRQLTRDAPRLSEFAPSVPPMIDLLIARALSRDAAERQLSVREFGEAIRAELATPSGGTRSVERPAAARLGRSQIVARDQELDRADRTLARLAEGRGGILLVGGEAGIGKSVLAASVLRSARNQGAFCVTGRCNERDAATPFAPFAEILDSLARLIPLNVFREVLGDAAAELARIQPSLRQTLPDIPAPFELPPHHQRRYLFGKYREYLERSCRVAPIVAVIEDVHWADAASLTLIEHIAGYASELPLLLVVTFRHSDVAGAAPFAAVLESLLRQQDVERLSLRRLDRTGTASLLRLMAGEPAPPLVIDLIHTSTDGNPFFVEEVYRHLCEEHRLFDGKGTWRTDLSTEQFDVPESIRLVLERRLVRLSATCRSVVTAAAVIGNRFPFAVLLALGEHTEAELLDAIDEATESRLIQSAGGGREVQYQFAHELIRQTLLASLSPPRRQRRHLKTASAIETLYGSRIEQHIADVAHHLYAAGESAQPERTIAALTRAAETAVLSSAFEEAFTQCERATAIAVQGGVAERGALQRVRGAALKGLGRWPEAIDTMTMALASFRREQMPTHSAQVALDLAWLMAWAADNQRVHDICTEALASLPEVASAERVRLLTLKSWALGYLSESGYEAGLSGIQAARDVAERLGDQGEVGFAFHSEAVFQLNYGRFDLCIRADDDAIPRLSKPKDVQWLIEAKAHRVLSLAWSQQLDEADAVIDGIMAMANELGNAGSLFQGALAAAASRGHRTGDLRAYQQDMQAIATGMPALGPYSLVALPTTVAIQVERGELSVALAAAAQAKLAFPESNQWSGLFAGCDLWCRTVNGDAVSDEESRRLARFIPTEPGAHFVGNRWFNIFAFLSHMEHRDYAAAASCYEVLCQTAAEGLKVGVLQSIEALAGAAAAAAGKWERAELHFDVATRQAESARDRLSMPSIQLWRAWMMHQRNARGDRVHANELLKAAAERFTSMEMNRSAARALAMLRAEPT